MLQKVAQVRDRVLDSLFQFVSLSGKGLFGFALHQSVPVQLALFLGQSPFYWSLLSW